MDKLDASTLRAGLEALPQWQLDDTGTAIRRSLRFADFSQAFGFMTQVALHAERHSAQPSSVQTVSHVVPAARRARKAR